MYPKSQELTPKTLRNKTYNAKAVIRNSIMARMIWPPANAKFHHQASLQSFDLLMIIKLITPPTTNAIIPINELITTPIVTMND